MRTPGFWYRPRSLTAALLIPAGALYAGAGRLRWRLARPVRVGVPVVCVGNLVAGGAGKTPIAIAVAQHLAAAGVAPHFLSRGYGGRKAGPLAVDRDRHSAREVGDEPLLLAAHAPCWVARDRVAGANAAIAAGAQAVVMDDGFQNPSLRKDLSLLVVDGETGFGNARPVPAGPLRESVPRGLARADAIVLMGADESGAGAALAAGPLPVLTARLAPVGDTGWLRGAPIVAFAGIARPERYFAMLERLGANLIARIAFADHERIPADELMQLIELADAAGATPLTTAKDYARLPDDARAMVKVLPVDVAWEDPSALDRILRPVIDRAADNR